MSDKLFFTKFSNAFTDILDQIQQEQFPAEVENGKIISAQWTCKDFLNFFIGLYFKYIKLLRDVEDAYDQTVHPQLRKHILKFLKNIMCRLVQVKKELIFYNNPILELPGIPYIFLDDYIIDYKMEPRDLDLVIPQYFIEDETGTNIEAKLIIDQRLNEKFGNCLPEEDIYPNKLFNVEVNFEEAIKMIQNLEMGRQGIQRIEKLDNKKDTDLAGELIVGDESKRLIFENLMAHYKLKKTKYDEMELLKMLPNNTSALDINLDPVKFSKETRDERKRIQNNNNMYYNICKDEIKDKFHKIEEDDLRENMKNERRDWISKQIMFNDPKTQGPPHDIKLYYQKDDVEKKEILDENQVKMKENIAKDKLKGKQDAKKKDENGQMVKLPLYSGASEEVKNLGNNIEQFKQTFETPNEYLNNRKFVSEKLAREEVIEELEKKVRTEVDEIIQKELTNLRYIFTKGKRDPLVPRKPPKPKPVKEKLGTGENKIKTVPPHELLSDSVVNGVSRKMVPKNLDDLICDFNYLSNSMQLIDEKMIDVPFFYTKQLCIYPLGSQLVRTSGKIVTNSILFHGPPGTGKTHAALAIAYHTNSLFFDFSPANLEKFKTKEELTKAVASAFRAARTYQPAIFYFDQAEQIFVGKLPRGVKKLPTATRLRKLFLTYKNLITPNMRIMFIGCTSEGSFMKQKDYSLMFDKSLYFSLPSTSDRYLLWKTDINKSIGFRNELDFDVLAEMSRGFSWNSIKKTIQNTLTPMRLERARFDPIKTEEFISYLSKTEFLFKQEAIQNRDFLYFASGLQALHTYLNEKRMENEKGKKRK